MHKETILVGKKKVGPGQPCFIIAEAGVNHNGDMKLAKELALVAKQAGADVVKFQTFNPDKLVTKKAGKAEYQKETTDAAESQLAMLKKLALGEKDFEELKRYCDKIGIMFLSTPFDSESVTIVNKLCPIIKISSTDTNNYPFIEQIARLGKPIMLSTGMSTMDEVKKAVEAIRKTGNDKIILLQCISSYPTPLEYANVAAMLELRKADVEIVGYSDHTVGNFAIFTAVALGANVVEKHFTLDKNMEGPDHKASADPKELEELIKGIRSIEKALGSGIKAPVKCEMENIPIVRKRLVAAVDIKNGHVITREMVEIKRSKNGAEPGQLNEVIGKKATRDISIDEGIEKEDVK
ncbi:MAG: N-acetylneuraminate synthase [Candidatus Micrarchaeota archaeon]